MPAAHPPLNPLHARWPEALIWAGAAACVLGFVLHRMWDVLPAARFGESLLLAGLAALLAWPLSRVRGWTFADALAVVWLSALVALTGIAPALAVVAMVAAATALGGVVIGATRPLVALLAGLAMLAALGGWTLPLRLHWWWVYAPLLALLIVWRRRCVQAQALLSLAAWRQAVAAAPRAAAASVMVLGLASAGAWLPTMQYDDLAYHLGLPWQLMLNGHYVLDPARQVWALAPWAGDVLQALPQVLARQEARGALNAVWLLATAAGLWQLGRPLGMSAVARWIVLALFASLPMVAALLGGMQTEAPAAAVTVALALLMVSGPADTVVRAARPRWLLAAALLFGLLCALKSLHGAAALPLLAWGLWRSGAQIERRWWFAAAAAALAVAGSSYTYAWVLTGNPVLPLLNDVFHSADFPSTSFNDARWQSGIGVALPWRLTFDTARFLEGWDGGIGFVLIALAGAWLVALADAGTRALTVCASLAVALPLLPLQYARYLHPGMVLLLPLLVAAVDRALPARRALWLLVGVCGLNLAFQANSQWLLHTGGIKRSLVALGRDAPLHARYAPERILAAALRVRAPRTGTVLVLDPATPSYAELVGRGRTTAWYDPAMQSARAVAERDPSGAGWASLLRREQIAEVILRPASLSAAQRAGLAQAGARQELSVGAAQWWRIAKPVAP